MVLSDDDYCLTFDVSIPFVIPLPRSEFNARCTCMILMECVCRHDLVAVRVQVGMYLNGRYTTGLL